MTGFWPLAAALGRKLCCLPRRPKSTRFIGDVEPPRRCLSTCGCEAGHIDPVCFVGFRCERGPILWGPSNRDTAGCSSAYPSLNKDVCVQTPNRGAILCRGPLSELHVSAPPQLQPELPPVHCSSQRCRAPPARNDVRTQPASSLRRQTRCAHRGPPLDHAHTAIDAHSAAQTDRNGMDSAGADVMRADCSGTKTGNPQIQYIPCRATEKGQVYIISSFPSCTTINSQLPLTLLVPSSQYSPCAFPTQARFSSSRLLCPSSPENLAQTARAGSARS